MKNKLLPFLIVTALTAIFSLTVSGQCVPNNDSVVGIEPDTLSTAFVGVPYEQIIYFKLPLDTSVQFGPVTLALIVDSLVINSYTGLPPSFSLACNSPSCTLLGGQNGCASITGTATEAEVGYHPLNVFVTTYVSDTFGTPVGGFPDTIEFYFLDVQFATEAGAGSAPVWSIGDFYPNPSSDKICVPLSVPVTTSADLSVMDMTGREWRKHTVELKKGFNPYWLTTEDLPDGCYFIRLKAQDHVSAAKFQVVHIR